MIETIRYQDIPETLLRPCSNPGLSNLITNGDMATRLNDYDQAVKQCSADKAAIKSLVEPPKPAGIK